MLGVKVIEHLLPHRAPFLMVESVRAYAGGDAPFLNAERYIRQSEAVFSGAEPPLYLPSVYIIEGLGQCCNLLSVILTCERRFATKGFGAEDFCRALMKLESSNGSSTSEQLLEIVEDDSIKTFSQLGMLASVDVEVTDSVCAGDVLGYKVEQTRVFRGLSRFTVSAFVDKRRVAHGTIVGARLEG
jgi:3-hydroxymyristoyl/3-hydroxydecanoyl-(acyl carrier protein) dehydratase